ncbi:hypothetical protein PV328_007935 [Microctonus aethiopoides]|uniref:Ankyrin repeat protein n=1 Tax=Microctonus aethiopoides TaxID=144406 RepID=A0AA39CAE0_9HYME|nr:hypothetical protein PV328_007935 [Microctonus aethiopoides]
MFDDNIPPLERAVRDEDLEKVRALLTQGANANSRVKWNDDTLLHYTSNVKILKELLLHGAYVDATNKYRETPLDTAVKECKLEIVKELLVHGADVNTTNRKGNTPLNIAVKSSKRNLEIMKVLLKNGADINIRNREGRFYEDYSTPLDNAVHYGLANLLIKYYLLKNFEKKNQKFINLDPYRATSNYNSLLNYFNECVCEIVQMKTHEVKNNLTLYELITMKNPEEICYNHLSMRLTKNNYSELSEKYPIYNEIIMDQMKPFARRIDLLNKLSGLQIYVSINMLNHNDKEEKVILDPDSLYYIANYLSNDELENLIIAFDHSDLQSKNNTAEQDTQFGEASTDCDHMNKRLKLE